MKKTRRNFLKILTSAATLPAWFPRLTFANRIVKPAAGAHTLICVFLRGGADGLNMIIPYAENRYYDLRPEIAIPEPGNGSGKALEIDGFFGMHPAMAPLKELFDDGALVPVISTGSHDDTHSHFEAMEFMESGVPGDKSVTTGWIARHLEVVTSANTSPFRALSIGYEVPSSLRGPVPATALSSIEEFHLDIYESEAERFQNTLQQLYAGTNLVETEAQQTLEAINTLAGSGAGEIEPDNGAVYPEDSEFAFGLEEIAKLIKADLGLEVACIDYGDWDTHRNQGGGTGRMAANLDDMSRALHAFYQDMGSRMANTTIVIMSEFGRRIDQNASSGTDHGHGGVMLVLGSGLSGGAVYGLWPGIAPNNLYGPGDLEITTDYRTVLAEILEKRLGNKNIAHVFPDYSKETYLGFA